MIFFACRQQQTLLKTKTFWLGCSITFLMLVPWGVWSLSIYKTDFFRAELGFHSMGNHQGMLFSRLSAILVVVLIFLVLRFWRQRLQLPLNEGIFSQRFLSLATTAFWVIVFVSIAGEIIRAFQFFSIPTHGWQGMMFEGELPTFYFGRLVEFSPFFLLSYASFLLWRDELNIKGRFIQFQALGILLFYILWGNFQSRYILATIPLLLILASYFFILILHRSARIKNIWLISLIIIICVFFAGFTVARLQHINSVLSFLNDLCYF